MQGPCFSRSATKTRLTLEIAHPLLERNIQKKGRVRNRPVEESSAGSSREHGLVTVEDSIHFSLRYSRIENIESMLSEASDG